MDMEFSDQEERDEALRVLCTKGKGKGKEIDRDPRPSQGEVQGGVGWSHARVGTAERKETVVLVQESKDKRQGNTKEKDGDKSPILHKPIAAKKTTQKEQIKMTTEKRIQKKKGPISARVALHPFLLHLLLPPLLAPLLLLK